MIAREYAHADPPHHVDYPRFCDDLERVFGPPRDLHKRTPQDAARAIAESSDAAAAEHDRVAALDDEQLNRVNKLMDRLRRVVRVKGVAHKPFFQAFDKVHKGVVSYTQFLSIMKNLQLPVSNDDLRLIYWRYRSEEKFAYRPFCAALDGEGENANHANNNNNTSNGTTSSGGVLRGAKRGNRTVDKPVIGVDLDLAMGIYTTRTKNANGNRDGGAAFDLVMRRLQTDVKRRNIDLREMLLDYDSLRRGYVTSPVLRRVLSSARLDLTDAEFDTLVSRYPSSKLARMVDYVALLADINEVFTASGLERSPTKTPKQVRLWRPEDEQDDENLTEAQQQHLDELLMSLGRLVHERGVLLKPMFLDWDANRSGCVTERQFRSVLCVFPVDIDEDGWRLLCEHYRRGDRGVSYQRMLDDIRQYEAVLDPKHPAESIEYFKSGGQAGRTTLSKPLAGKRKANSRSGSAGGDADNGSINVEALLQRLRAVMARNRMDIQSAFQDFDRLRSGNVTPSIFHRTLAVMHLNLSPAEADALRARYTIADGPYKGNVLYQEFVDDVQSALSQKNLERNPSGQPVQFDARQVDDMDAASLSQEETKLVDGVVRRIGALAVRRRLVLAPLFRQFDPSNRGAVLPHRFLSVLKNLDLFVSEEEFAALSKRFRKDRDFVNYRQFAAVVDQYNNNS
eukprot:TRINITY_DN60647_c0_g3_i1.p1 TRINITY_DN60647_c0_g3~~TRINITY_DN60647_c0_g3_i1.p1  ORF type:complete len:735 (+),score=439.38 TRINITY_DN60647_c0_g3_i1:166-2205(+)